MSEKALGSRINGIKSLFPGPSFVLALAGIRRPMSQTTAIKKGGLIPGDEYERESAGHPHQSH
jgi:hypothetical protein